jgi:hypothetical protein
MRSRIELVRSSRNSRRVRSPDALVRKIDSPLGAPLYWSVTCETLTLIRHLLPYKRRSLTWSVVTRLAEDKLPYAVAIRVL